MEKSSSHSNLVSRSSRRIRRSPFTHDDSFVGKTVQPHVRKAGPYLLGPKLGSSPVKSIVTCLGRKTGTEKYYQLKILTLSESESLDEKQGKMLLHIEHSLLSLLENVPGVIQKHDFFTDVCLHEEEISRGKVIYSGRKSKRICLVLDLCSPNDFAPNSKNLINLQHHVIREKKLSERDALPIFYNIVKIVEELHERNIVHRDLKLGNLVMNRLDMSITIKNFCLGKHLMKENDYLTDQRGSPAYISPDVLSGKPYLGKPSDVWALGVVLYTLLYGQFPFYDSVPSELFNKIQRAEYSFPDDGRVFEETKKLISRLLVVNPLERLTASALRSALEDIIFLWKSISPSDLNLQLVPDVDHERKDHESRSTSLNSLTPSYSSAPSPTVYSLPSSSSPHSFSEHSSIHRKESKEESQRRRLWSSSPFKRNAFRIPVTRIFSDARPLNPEECRLYGNLLLPSNSLSTSSRQLNAFQAVPVLEQNSVLDLSSSTSQSPSSSSSPPSPSSLLFI